MIGGFICLVALWLLRTRVRQGRWTWETPALGKVNLALGLAPEVIVRPEETRLWRQAWHKFVEGL
jgi:hypothetical protein